MLASCLIPIGKPKNGGEKRRRTMKRISFISVILVLMFFILPITNVLAEATTTTNSTTSTEPTTTTNSTTSTEPTATTDTYNDNSATVDDETTKDEDATKDDETVEDEDATKDDEATENDDAKNDSEAQLSDLQKEKMLKELKKIYLQLKKEQNSIEKNLELLEKMFELANKKERNQYKEMLKEEYKEKYRKLKTEEKEIKAYVNGKLPNFDVKPEIKNGRTLVPLRAIAESLGTDVKWDQVTQTITLTKGDTTITLTIDAKTATVNGQELPLDVAPTIKNNRTIVPLRFISEALKANVEYDAATNLIFVDE